MKFNKLTANKVDIETFINTHNHINYCEAIIYPDGTISYAVPSHEQILIKECGITTEEARSEIPESEMPLDWLLKKSGCIAVWTEYCYCARDVTMEQKRSLIRLLEEGLTKMH